MADFKKEKNYIRVVGGEVGQSLYITEAKEDRRVGGGGGRVVPPGRID